MPIYEYECEDCGKISEVMQKFDDEPLSTCPICGGIVHKLISQSSFILKGTGWYVTDYARAQNKRKEEKTKSESKNDSKLETTKKN